MVAHLLIDAVPAIDAQLSSLLAQLQARLAVGSTEVGGEHGGLRHDAATQTLLLSVLFMAAWTVFLVLCVGVYRVVVTVVVGAKRNQFPSDQPHGPPLYRRFNQAHHNAVENLVVWTALVAVAVLSGASVENALMAKLAVVFALGRIGQSFFHVLSNHPNVVALRFTCFTAQLASYMSMIALLAAHVVNFE